MSEVVQLWVYLSATPLFGLTATLLVYALAHGAYLRAKQAPWANPVLWSVVTLACGLLATGVPYPTYFAGAQFIHFLLGPAVQKPVSETAEFLLSHLSLLFVPVGVGVMTHLSLVSQYGARMLAVVVLSTLAGLAVTALALQLLRDDNPSRNRPSAKDADV